MAKDREYAAEGSTLKYWMNYRGLTQKELADEVDWSVSTLGRLQRGTQKADPDQLDTLMSALQFTREQYEVQLSVLRNEPFPESVLAKLAGRLVLVVQDQDKESRISLPFNSGGLRFYQELPDHETPVDDEEDDEEEDD